MPLLHEDTPSGTVKALSDDEIASRGLKGAPLPVPSPSRRLRYQCLCFAISHQPLSHWPPPRHSTVTAPPPLLRRAGRRKIYEGSVSSRFYSTEEEAIAGSMATVHAYIAKAGAALQGRPSAFRRAKPLMALPMPGVGLMDISNLVDDLADVVEPLLAVLYEAAAEYRVDIALCTVDEGAFRVAQMLRPRCCPWEGGPFGFLGPDLLRQVAALQEKASIGRLGVLFGAGVSVPSGLPSWDGLLRELAVRAGFSVEEQEALSSLGLLDQSTLIEERMGGRVEFKAAVADCVRHGRFTPAHAILGALKLPAVTTNYDSLYERAVASTGDGGTRVGDNGEESRASEGAELLRRLGSDKCSPPDCGDGRGGVLRASGNNACVMRLPWDAARVRESQDSVRRLLKIHGCVSDPKSIVLTREDYMRYGDNRHALRGLLHQTFLEREVLVVGFSMNDDNVHLIIDQVRKALQTTSTNGGFKMGTVLTLAENSMFRQLWERDFRVVSCGVSQAEHARRKSDGVYDPSPEWTHDIFLDALASGLTVERAGCSFILDDSYASLLEEPQRKIKAALSPLQELMRDDDLRNCPALKRIQQLLEELGATGMGCEDMY